jgi:hypothetical protein
MTEQDSSGAGESQLEIATLKQRIAYCSFCGQSARCRAGGFYLQSYNGQMSEASAVSRKNQIRWSQVRICVLVPPPSI